MRKVRFSSMRRPPTSYESRASCEVMPSPAGARSVLSWRAPEGTGMSPNSMVWPSSVSRTLRAVARWDHGCGLFSITSEGFEASTSDAANRRSGGGSTRSVRQK